MKLLVKGSLDNMNFGLSFRGGIGTRDSLRSVTSYSPVREGGELPKVLQKEDRAVSNE